MPIRASARSLHIPRARTSPPPTPSSAASPPPSRSSHNRNTSPPLPARQARPLDPAEHSVSAGCRRAIRTHLGLGTLVSRAAAESSSQQTLALSRVHRIAKPTHPQRSPIPTTRANRQHGRRRVMIGTVCRTTSTPLTLLGLPMRQPHAPSPRPRRATPRNTLLLEPG